MSNMADKTNYPADHWSFTKFARKCDCCGKGMNEGYVWGDGEGYACSDECLYVDGYTKEQFKEDYENDAIYWTEWHDDTEESSLCDGYFTAEGEEVEGEWVDGEFVAF